MKKNILYLLLGFIVLLLIPLIWKSKVSLNLADFTSEYYKSIINIFVIGLVSIYFQKNWLRVEQGYKKNVELKLIKDVLKNMIMNKSDLVNLKYEWLKLDKSEQIKKFNDYNVINNYINSLNETNFQEHILTQQYNIIIEKLNNIYYAITE